MFGCTSWLINSKVKNIGNYIVADGVSLVLEVILLTLTFFIFCVFATDVAITVILHVCLGSATAGSQKSLR